MCFINKLLRRVKSVLDRFLYALKFYQMLAVIILIDWLTNERTNHLSSRPAN